MWTKSKSTQLDFCISFLFFNNKVPAYFYYFFFFLTQQVAYCMCSSNFSFYLIFLGEKVLDFQRSSSSFFIAAQDFVVWMYQSVFKQFSTHGHLCDCQYLILGGKQTVHTFLLLLEVFLQSQFREEDCCIKMQAFVHIAKTAPPLH